MMTYKAKNGSRPQYTPVAVLRLGLGFNGSDGGASRKTWLMRWSGAYNNSGLPGTRNRAVLPCCDKDVADRQIRAQAVLAIGRETDEIV